MKTKWLFPYRFRLTGWFIFVPSAVLGLAYLYNDFDVVSFFSGREEPKIADSLSELFSSYSATDEIAAIGVIIGLLLVAFSREKVEDEMISQLRLEAMQWSVYANYVILIIAILTVYDGAFLEVMVYNMFTVLLVFIARFRWLIRRSNNLLLL